ncbi:MAG: type IX secretion system sortase PorU [Lutibacter sp.]|uniref:type IX secretion system sortase PorU n=1 Tax=Lutibacter sp. TaxID=1925666 RepID=UPI003858FF89
MNKLKRNLLIGFFIVGNILFSQQTENKNIQLKWIEAKDFIISKNNKIRTSIVEGNFLDKNLNPTFTQRWKVANGLVLKKYTIKNVIFETLPVSKFSIINSTSISETLNAEFNIVSSRNDTYAILNLTPLIKEGNRIKKIVSFEIEYSLVASTKNRETTNYTVKNSVLADGNWYKFSVDTTGVFKIDGNFLSNLGIDVNTINPKNIQIYGNGGEMLSFKNSDFRHHGLQENAIYVSGENDNTFNKNDYILFYAKGPHTWKNVTSNNLNEIKHQFNIFSDKAFYFITIGNNEGKRIVDYTPITASSNQQITTFHDFTFFEKDEINMFAAGQQWFGDSFSVENVHNYVIPFENIDTSEDILVKVRGVAESSVTSQMEVKVNNQNLFNVTLPANGGLTKAVANQNSGGLQLSGNSVNVEIYYNNNGNPSANAYLDYIEVLGKKKLIANGNQFIFRNLDVNSTSGIFEYSIQNSTNITKVWDVSNALTPTNIINESSNSNFNFKINGGVSKEYIVLNENDYYVPEIVENPQISNQNLHSLNNLDYIIITQDFLFEQAQRLADYHIENSNLKTKVISLNEIYNEFSSGSPDITAIRDFVRHLYSNSTTNRLKYVCLFGDASYDYKNRIGGNNNIVPVFEAFDSFNLATSYVTDDFYGMMDANEGEMNSFERQDVVTGRIPVSDALQAKQVVDKILSYYSSKSFGDWRTQITLVADDIDATGEELLQIEMEKIADTIAINNPTFNLKKVYIDAYTQETSSGGNRYPTVNSEITNQVEKGTLLVDYFGHGGEDGWAAERILEVSDIQNWKNEFKLPLFITVTCEFSRFDNPLRKTAGEFLFWNKNGGAASLISTTREIFISVGQALNERLIKPLLNFNNENYTIAESLMNVKNQFSTTQRYFIFSLGDPAMKLSIPSPTVKINKINDVDISQSLDTIKALSYVKFEGEVTNSNGIILNNFNGELDVVVYDKPINKTTLDNDNRNITMQFDAIESKIFKGRSTVESGKFTFDFVAPRDLKVAYGKGKLSFYATNSLMDKAGYNFDITIGGINTNAPEDTTGPIVQLYMNDLNFVEGGNTNESPLFIAVLEDESGINTSITAVDHDIVAILDGDQANPIILNDFYQTELNDFKKGKVSYPFRALSTGLHTLILKVWDTYNNLTETTFSFFVVDDSDLVLSNVLNYPNPFVNYTEFWFNHNKPNELLNVQIQIFTVSGKIVKTINETVQSEGNLCRSLTWNGLDDFGSKIGKGVYIYKLKVISVNSNAKAEKIEKLVILQ